MKAKGEGGSGFGVPTVERRGVTCVRHVRGKREPDPGGFLLAGQPIILRAKGTIKHGSMLIR